MWQLRANIMYAKRRYETHDSARYAYRYFGKRSIFADRLIGQTIDAASHSFQFSGGYEPSQHNSWQACLDDVARTQQHVLLCKLKDGVFAGLGVGHGKKYVAKSH